MADETPAAPTVVTGSATPEAQAMATVAAAVTGAGSPDAAAIKTAPPWFAVWSLILGGPILSAGILAMLWVVVTVYWPEVARIGNAELMGRIIWGWFAITAALVCALCVVVFRLAAGNLKKVEARAGPAGITLEGGG